MGLLLKTACKETNIHAAMRMIADDKQCFTVTLANIENTLPNSWKVASEEIQRDEPTVLADTPNCWMVLMPLCRTTSEKQFVLGIITASDKSLVEKMANTAWQHAKLKKNFDMQCTQLDGYADQVLNDFTQFDWMQNLIGHLDCYSALDSFAANARRLLEPLRALVHARALAFVPASEMLQDSGTNSDLPGVWLAEDDKLKPIARRLVRRYGKEAISRIIVRNRFVDWPDVVEFSDINGFVLVAIVKNQHLVGWLISIDSLTRASDDSINQVSFGRDSLHTDEEFSTGDAMLLRAAASILATHDQNLRLIVGNKNLSMGVIRALANAVDAKDPYTHGHSDRVARMAQHLAMTLGLSGRDLQRVLVTGLLHDVGKIGVPDAVLSKPGKLTDKEFDFIKQHPVIGYEIIKPIDELQFAREGVLHHHEAYDGRGYPYGLSGQEIPLWARIMAVADAFDAMTSDRPYRQGMKWEVAEEIIRSGAGKQWDPDIVAAFEDQRLSLRQICQHDSNIRESCYQLDANALLTDSPMPTDLFPLEDSSVGEARLPNALLDEPTASCEQVVLAENG